MTVYPFAIDDDQTIIRIDDNLSELGTQVINQIRGAIFAIEKTLGVQPNGSLSSVADRLDVSINPNGTIKSSALTSVGLATLPIVDNQVANNAGIKEIKLALDFNTSDLNALIQANIGLLGSLSAFAATINSDLLIHISGGAVLSDGVTAARHVASHIDLNAVPSDPRDPSFTWTGLLDRLGAQRPATQTASALLEINNDLIDHLNATSNAHPATAITVDTSNFNTIPNTVTNAQETFDAIDDANTLVIGRHQATLHSNGVPQTARSELINGPDGYSQLIVPATPCNAFLVRAPATGPVDNNATGDDIVAFDPSPNSGFNFDAAFSQVRVGDVIRINYGNGFSAQYLVESTRFLPGQEWVVRLNGTNLFNADGYVAFAQINRPLFDPNKFGTVAVAAANNDIDGAIPASLVVGDPKGAVALGIGFDPTKLDSSHYNLYINLYPTGDPTEQIIQLPAIDVTGNQGATPGTYTLRSVVLAANNSIRAAGFNLRVIAFEFEGNFGVMVADSIGGTPAFSIVSGVVSGATLAVGSFTNNVVGDATDGKDPLGFGGSRAGLASPDFTASYSSGAAAASLATLIFPPLKFRDAIVNGLRVDEFAPTYLANEDGYWPAIIFQRTAVGATTVEITYRVDLDLEAAGLFPGKTIVVQPDVEITDPLYNDVDYGRFIIKDVSFKAACPPDPDFTFITVINGLHATGAPIGSTGIPELPVRLHFGEDSVGFNASNVIDAVNTGVNYVRFHEVYLTDQGVTFTHERARLPKQDQTNVLLRTDANWTITDVSKKLRGFGEAGTFQRFVRFYVLNYNSVTGEYDGYIGQRDPATDDITNFGPVVRARKNIPARFFDNSFIDFIELEFVESSPSPGTDIIIGSSGPRYVDIEIFPTLSLDDELLLLAGATFDNNRIINLKDLREFGNISEKDFTSSAIRFLESPERLLHGNGVFTGLDFVGEDPSNPGTLIFNGGVALVNGHISTVNNLSISIPEVLEDLTPFTTPQTLEYAICVNQFNNLEAILLTPIKQQFFAELPSGSTSFYTRSVTFSELVNTRKDLTPIAIVNATISSVLINSVTDARRFIESETVNIPFSWVSDPEMIRTNGGPAVTGSFYTIEALLNWINLYGASNNLIKVRGRIDIDTALDLSSITNGVTLEGENAILDVSSDNGIILGNNVTIRNLKFFYNPLNFVPATAGDRINTGTACLYRQVASGSVLQNVIIENVEIETLEFGNQRPPHIGIELQNDALLQNVTIRNCRFDDDTSVPTPDQAAIAVVALRTGTGTGGPVAANVLVDGNKGNLAQGCYFVTSTPSGNSVVDFGLLTYNVNITNNNFGIIGYGISSNDNSAVNFDGQFAGISVYKPNGLNIVNNTATIILSAVVTGNEPQGRDFTSSTGHVKITGNRVSFIHPNFREDSVNNLRSSLIIEDNILTATDTNGFQNSAALFFNEAAIYAYSIDNTVADTSILIKNNIVQSDLVDSVVYNYVDGVLFLSVSANISGNILRGFGSLSNPIFLSGTAGVDYSFMENKLYRESTDISSYVFVTGSVDARIIDNFFDNFEVAAGNTVTILDTSTGNVIAEHNKNQTVEIFISPTQGLVSLNGDVVSAPSAGFITYNDFADLWVLSTVVGSIQNFLWRTDVRQVAPLGARIVSARVNVAEPAALGPTNQPASLTISRSTTSDANTGSAPATIVVTATNDYIIDETIPVFLTVRQPIEVADPVSHDLQFSLLRVTIRY